jgi:hypothetical protein
MTVYLYGLIEAPAPNLSLELADLPGLQGPLQVHDIGAWGLVYSDHDSAEILPKRRLLLTHTRVLEEMLRFGTVLPARFGLVSDTVEKVEGLILGKSATIKQEFARVHGCFELGIRVNYPRKPALDATLAQDPALAREREKLSHRGAEAHFAMAEFGGKLADKLDRRRGAAQAQLLQALVPLCRSHVLRAPEEDTEVLRAEFLIPAPTQADFIAAVEQACHALTFAPGAEPAIQVIGPVPMYNFVRLSLALDPQEEAA